MKRIKFDGMIVATFLTNLFYASTYPYIHKIIMTEASDDLVAFNQIINCVTIVLFGSIWNKKSNSLFKFYPILLTIEIICNVTLSLWVIFSNASNIVVYYMMDTLIFSIVTRNICCGYIKLKAARYRTEDAREQFDNNNNSASAIATIIGSVIAMILELNFNTMLILATIGNIIDNIFYICIFFKHQKSKEENNHVKT